MNRNVRITEPKERDSRLALGKAVYAAGVLLIITGYLYIMAVYRDSFRFPAWLLFLQAGLSFYGVYLGKTWKDKGFIFLSLYYAFMLIHVILRNPEKSGDSGVSSILLHAIWCFGACYSFGRVFTREQSRRLLSVFSGIWTAGIVIHSCIALYAVFSSRPVWNLTHGAFWGLGTGLGEGAPGFAEQNAVQAGKNLRLYVIYYFTISGAIISFSAVIALCNALVCKNATGKILYAAALVPLLLCVGLTDARAAHISCAFGMAVPVFVKLYDRLSETGRKKERGPGRALSKRWVVVLLSLTGMTAVFLLAVIIIGRAGSVVTDLSANGTVPGIRSAAAEGAASTVTVANRGFSGSLDQILTGRVTIWKNVLKYLRADPVRILTGASIYRPMDGVNALAGGNAHAAHAHNILLQVLLESGIIGLALVICMAVPMARKAVKALISRGRPLWERLLPMIVFSFWVGEMAECIARVHGYFYPNCSVLFLFMGMICASDPEKGRTDLQKDGKKRNGENGRKNELSGI